MIRRSAQFLFLMVPMLCMVGCSDRGEEPMAEIRSLPTVSGSALQDFVTGSELPVLVEFGVDYQCERCRQMKPSVVGLGEQFAGQAEVVRVDFNQNAALVSQLGGTICPTYVFFQGGQPVRTESFPISSEMLGSYLDAMVEPNP